ncbi:MAG: 50S ribosomal protein L25/general stress protein Ctc [Proteobacteria bacterium]|nr:50S ribosomal protein L25/general stress protein Ctc [Pseudomonadota bacterium]
MRQENLAVKIREDKGKGAARRLRSQGMIPAVFYGSKTEPIHLAVGNKDLKTILNSESGSSTFLNLNFDEGKQEGKIAVIKDLQINPVKDTLIHVDFFELSMNEKMTSSVPVEFVGKAEGVELGGTLQPIRRELEVSCLPKDLPSVIKIDVTTLGLGQSIHIDDVQLPEGVEVPHDVNFTIAVVLAKRGAAEGEEAVEGEEEAAVAAPEAEA